MYSSKIPKYAISEWSLFLSLINSTSNNVAIGNYVMYGLATGSSNIGIGNQALYHNNTGTKKEKMTIVEIRTSEKK